MSNKEKLNKELDQDFDQLLAALKRKDQKAWVQLVGQLRRVTVPWLARKAGNLPDYALVSLDEFILEVFANALATYYPLFKKGHFTKAQELQSLMFRVAELKLKEGFAQLKKDRLIYHPKGGDMPEIADGERLTTEEELKKERIENIQKQMKGLSKEDQELLQQYYAGEKLIKIARELNITESSIRKRKQRALDRLKKLVSSSIFVSTVLSWINNI